MRILVSISFYTPYISGLTICAKNYAEGLLAKGHRVTVVTTQHDKELRQREMVGEIEVHRIPYLFRLSKGFFMPKFIQKAWSFVALNDVIIINLPQFEGFILALIGKILHKKIISIYHCEVTLPKGIINKILEITLIVSNFITLSLSYKIVTYTKDYAKSTILIPMFAKKSIYNLPPVKIPVVEKNFLLELRKKIPAGKIIIGVAARIAAEKGIEYLIEGIPLIEEAVGKEIIVLIAGPKSPVGENSYWKKLYSLLEKFENKIIFLGSISHEKLGTFYDVLDILVLPSINKTEAFGLVQVEAMMLGIPVVASDLPGVRIPTVLSGMGERSKLKDSADLAKQISKIVLHKNKYTKGFTKIKSIFSYERSLDEFEKIVVS